MKITPCNGEIIVSQGNKEFGKLYTETFPDNKTGISDAFMWAESIALGWRDEQDKDWEKHHAV